MTCREAEMRELTGQEIERQDYVDNAIHQLLQELCPSELTVGWNIEMIADIRERIRHWLVEQYGLIDEMTFYPYIEV
jgi:hypothetical protein